MRESLLKFKSRSPIDAQYGLLTSAEENRHHPPSAISDFPLLEFPVQLTGARATDNVTEYLDGGIAGYFMESPERSQQYMRFAHV